ncbi:hypothetical protein [uncultured Tateyamaria sp.]|uniref:hypothetical protein n=1 Tax=uncultured Tateyamaria sp. TaxID=455651 RepID=UPI002622711B|nr:hypothetical protein [uncultured Tateyamaria sp.]
MTDKRWSSKCDVTIFHVLVSVAFNQKDVEGDAIHSAPTLSRYRAVLRFADEKGMDGPALVEKLKASSLDAFYKEALKKFRYDYLDDYVEDDEDRFQRSIQHLGELGGLPVAKFSDDLRKPKTETGFATAIVKVQDDDFKVLGFVNEQMVKQEVMQKKVSALVPAEAKRTRKKLADKKLYWLYVSCDLYSRFLPDHASRKSWSDAAKTAKLPLLDENTTQAQFDQYAAQIIKQREEDDQQKVQIGEALQKSDFDAPVLKKFRLLDALEFREKDQRFHARTITTHPNTPCVEIWPDAQLPGEVLQDTVAMQGRHAKRFVSDFPRFAEWTWSAENGAITLKDENGDTSPATLQNVSGLAQWKAIDPTLEPVARYRLDRSLMVQLQGWRDEYANIPRIGHSAFKNMMKLEADPDGLNLVHPLESKHRKQLGIMTSGATPVFSTTRFFDFKTAEALLQLAEDYGTEFELELLDGLEGLSALRIIPQDFPVSSSITLPLMLSNKGNPAEITATI